MKTREWMDKELDDINQLNWKNTCRERAFERLEKKICRISLVWRHRKWKKAYRMMVNLVEEMEYTNREAEIRISQLEQIYDEL